MLVKICGIRTKSAAMAAANAGADFLGFNFVPSSKRKVSILTAKNLIAALPKNRRPKLVGVFMNQPLLEVNKIAKQLKLDFVQLHGKESPEYCLKIKATGVIKAISLPANFIGREAKNILNKYHADFYLLDRQKQGRGKFLNPRKVKVLSKDFKILLAGGLNTENIASLVASQKNLSGVDVAGGVETEGKQDVKKIASFIKLAKNSKN